MGILEAVDGLVIVADYADLRRRAEVSYRRLLRFVQVLKLVNEEMLKLLVLGRRRVVLEVAHQVGDELPDQHALVEVEPVEQIGLELILGIILGEARFVALALRLGGGVALYHFLDLSLAAIGTSNIEDHGLRFKCVQRAGNAADGLQNMLPG